MDRVESVGKRTVESHMERVMERIKDSVVYCGACYRESCIECVESVWKRIVESDMERVMERIEDGVVERVIESAV